MLHQSLHDILQMKFCESQDFLFSIFSCTPKHYKVCELRGTAIVPRRVLWLEITIAQAIASQPFPAFSVCQNQTWLWVPVNDSSPDDTVVGSLTLRWRDARWLSTVAISLGLPSMLWWTFLLPWDSLIKREPAFTVVGLMESHKAQEWINSDFNQLLPSIQHFKGPFFNGPFNLYP